MKSELVCFYLGDKIFVSAFFGEYGLLCKNICEDLGVYITIPPSKIIDE